MYSMTAGKIEFQIRRSVLAYVCTKYTYALETNSEQCTNRYIPELFEVIEYKSQSITKNKNKKRKK